MFAEEFILKTDLATLKKGLLMSLKSTNYKRYLGSPLRYGGGKSLAVGTIIEKIPTDIKRVISPFFGGGSVEICLAKELDIQVIGFDIFYWLTNYWDIQIHQQDKLYEELSKLRNTKEEYNKIRDIIKPIWNKDKDYLFSKYSKLELAVLFYFNHNLSYGPGFPGWFSSNYLDDKKYKSMLEKVKNFKCPNLEVFNDTFDNIIPKYNNDFLYLDPPYFLNEDSKMFHGIYPNRNNPINHDDFNHELLCELLKKHNERFVLSYNDCSWVREKYKDFNIEKVSWQYTMGQGETRIGKNRLERDYDNDNVKHSHELLITNF